MATGDHFVHNVQPFGCLLISSPQGHSGKTIVSIGLCKAFRRKGFSVQPFKKGPDYIDPSWLTVATGRSCRNLDLFLIPKERLIRSFRQASQGIDLAIIEGAMGLYDGMDSAKNGTTAEIARLLNIPTLLAVNTTRMTGSIAAMVTGYQRFQPDTKIAGVILNHVSGRRHERKLRDAVEQYCAIPVVGSVPRDHDLHMSERHLGHIPSLESGEAETLVERIGRRMESYLDLDGILEIAQKFTPPHPAPLPTRLCHKPVHGSTGPVLSPALRGIHPSRASGRTVFSECPERSRRKGSPRTDHAALKINDLAVRPEPVEGETANYDTVTTGEREGVRGRETKTVQIGVIRDRVFNFYYPENIEALAEAGAELIFINSLKDRLPDIDGLYIGGGFPEFFLEELEENRGLRQDIAEAVEAGLPVYAECAGLMYLCRSIRWQDRSYEMIGIIPADIELSQRPEGHGYAVAEVIGENPFFPVGLTLRGHEFHHSRVSIKNGVKFAYQIRRGHGIDGKRDGVLYKNMFAAYTHLHALGTPCWAEAFVSLAAREKKSRRREKYD